MAEEAAISVLLNQLRGPKMNSKKLFADFLPEAWKLFGLSGDPDLVLFEAFLIYAIIRCVGIETKNYKIGEIDNIDKETAQKHDSYLLALGLLKGYRHTKDDGTNYVASERHKQYLKECDLIAINYPNPKPSDNLNINRSNSLPRQVLSSADYRCRNDLCELLSKDQNCKKCFEEGTKKFIDEDKHSTIFPEPLYTLKNFSPDNSMWQETGQEQDPDENPNTKPKLRRWSCRFAEPLLRFVKNICNRQKTLKGIVVLLTFVVIALIVVVILLVSSRNTKDAQGSYTDVVILDDDNELQDINNANSINNDIVSNEISIKRIYDDNGNMLEENISIKGSSINTEEILEYLLDSTKGGRP